MFLNTIPHIITVITVITCDSPGHHLIIQIIPNVGMTTSIIWIFTFRIHSTIQIIIKEFKNPHDAHV